MSFKAFVEQKQHGSLINGCYHKGNASIDLISPTSKRPWKMFSAAGQKEADSAILTAHEAFLQWRQTLAPHRANLLRTLAAMLVEERALFARVMALEMGKPLKEGIAEVEYAASYFDWFAGEAERLYGYTIPAAKPNKSLKLIYEPLGVVGIITPWNFPIAMAARKVAAALAAGCSCVVKPSPECPMSMLMMARLALDAKLPSGVFNVLIGDEQMIGKALLDSPLVRKLSFTGSTEVGRYLYQQSAQTLKKLTLELGGHAPVLVFDDASIERAVKGTMEAKFRNTGQTCIAANRILVQEGIFEDFLALLTKKTKELRAGDPLNEESDLSSVLHPASIEKVQAHVADAVEKGATLHLDPEELYEPKILTHITPEMKIFREETFGPVIAMMTFKTVDEGIALANDSEYGLAAYVFTESMQRASRATTALEYGIIGVNDGLPSTAEASFGGIKNSGFGREGGPTGLKEYLTEKYISIAF